jgi:hypothetical protein
VDDETALREAQIAKEVAMLLIPIGAAVALITVGIIRSNLAFISAGAGFLGIPGIGKVSAAIRKQGDGGEA